MTSKNFESVMWTNRDTVSSNKLSKVQKNSDNIYDYRYLNPRGILKKYQKTDNANFAVTSGMGTTPQTIYTFTNVSIEANRYIGFGLYCPYIQQTSTTTTNIPWPVIFIKVDTTENLASCRSYAIDENFDTSSSVAYLDGLAINYYYMTDTLSKGTYNFSFMVKNNNTVGQFDLASRTYAPLTLWIEDIGGIRAYV